MIEVKRGQAPSYLRGLAIDQARVDAGEFFALRSRATRQRQYDFEEVGVLNHPQILDALRVSFSDCCGFCGIDGEGDYLAAHRFRPPQDAVAGDGGTSRRHYWWLAYEWDNLYLACADCRKAQGSKFPVEGKRARVGTGKNFEGEGSLLLDPCRENPETHLIYLDTGEVVSSQPRGKVTIETFDLNRPALRDARLLAELETNREIGAAARALRDTPQSFHDNFSLLYSKNRPFAALCRQRFNQWVQMRPRQVEAALSRGMGEKVTLADVIGELPRVTNRRRDEATAIFFEYPIRLPEFHSLPARPLPAKPRPAEIPNATARGDSDASMELDTEPIDAWTAYRRSVEIRRIEIRNFRAIEHLDLELAAGSSEGSWVMLLGENGAGKTSVLQAIALALSDKRTINRLGLDPDKLLRQGATAGQVVLELTGSRRRRKLRFGKDIEGFRLSGNPKDDALFAGYGSTRLLPVDRVKRSSLSKIKGLFDPFAPLANPHDWLPTLNSADFDAVARGLKRLLVLDEEEELEQTKNGVELVHAKGRLALADLSDGYRAMSVFVLDMMQMFLQRWGSFEAAEGIVLVDELGAHLHPRWQMRVTQSLRDTFPRVQFIATTHDPLCLRGLREGEVVVLRRIGRDVFKLQDELPSVEGIPVDQLLTSEHFGLNSTVDPAIERLFERYYELLARRARDGNEERELASLNSQLVHFRLLGSTRRERLALEAADGFLAEERQAKTAAAHTDLTEGARRRINEIWREASAP